MGDYRFLHYEPEKPLILPPDPHNWLPDEHLERFISDVVDRLGLNLPVGLTTEIVQPINPMATSHGNLLRRTGRGRLLWRARTFHTE